MAVPGLSNVGQLNASLSRYAGRTTAADLYPGFIGLAESMINFGEGEINFRPLRVRDMEVGPVPIAVVGGLGPVPVDFLEAKSVIRGDGKPLAYLSPIDYAARYPGGDQSGSGPVHYSVVGQNLLVAANVNLVYYGVIAPTLVAAADGVTNWLLTKAPNAYLYGCLYHYAVYQKNSTMAGGYLDMMRRGLMGLNFSDSFFSRAGHMQIPAGTTVTP